MSPQAAAKSPSSQRFHHISADLTDPTEGPRIIEETTAWNDGNPPDIVWCCAGAARPGLFVDTPVETLKSQVETNFFSGAYMAHAALRSWLQPSKTSPPTTSQARHLIFTSSIVAFYPIVGYATYGPSKAALRSLADSLSQELHLYPTANIKIHTIYPGTIFSPGLENENKTKPAVTLKLEEADGGQTPEEVALTSVQGLERGEESVTAGIMAHTMKASMLGFGIRNGWGIVDTLLSWVGSIIVPIVRMDMDKQVGKWGKAHGSGDAGGN